MVVKCRDDVISHLHASLKDLKGFQFKSWGERRMQPQSHVTIPQRTKSKERKLAEMLFFGVFLELVSGRNGKWGGRGPPTLTSPPEPTRKIVSGPPRVLQPQSVTVSTRAVLSHSLWPRLYAKLFPWIVHVFMHSFVHSLVHPEHHSLSTDSCSLCPSDQRDGSAPAKNTLPPRSSQCGEQPKLTIIQ